jgi:hypothetical protein
MKRLLSLALVGGIAAGLLVHLGASAATPLATVSPAQANEITTTYKDLTG